MGRYTLRARLESGELADLYRGEDDRGRSVAIKVFTPRTSDSTYGKALADVSARARGLKAPGIIAFHEVGMVEDRLVAVRDDVEGYTLGQALQRLSAREVAITPELSLFVAAEACRAVAAAHGAGLAHGAITPGNVLLGFDGAVRVCDFGALEAMAAAPALKAFAQKGRGAYRAPEQSRPGPASPSADVYSLGAILYEVLTLREVAGERGGSISTKRDALMAPSRRVRRLNQRVDPVVMRALDLSVGRRYADARELQEAIRELFAALGVAPSAPALGKWVRELFPTEVSIAGDASNLAFTSAFTLSTIAGAAEVGTEPVEPSAPRRAFSGSIAGAADDADAITAPAAEPVPDAFLAGAMPEPGAPPLAAAESWYAPPGRMDPVRARARPEARAPMRADTPVDPPRADAAEPVRSDMAPAVPAADDAGKTREDWRVPPAPVARPRRLRSVKAWAVAGGGALLLALFFGYAARQFLRRLGHEVALPPNLAKALDTGVALPELAARPFLEPRPRPPAARDRPGVLRIVSDQPAWVLVNDTNLQRKTPIAAYSMDPGRHVVRFVHAQTGARIDKEVVVREGATTTVSATFVRARRRR